MRIRTLTFSVTLNSSQGSQQLLARNEYRVALAIQNLAPASATTAILYFAFGVDAGPNQGIALGPGKGLYMDTICSKDALLIYMDDTTGQPLTIMEIVSKCAN